MFSAVETAVSDPVAAMKAKIEQLLEMDEFEMCFAVPKTTIVFTCGNTVKSYIQILVSYVTIFQLRTVHHHITSQSQG